MTQDEFEKRRAAQVKTVDAMIGVRIIKIIDLVELLLEQNPAALVAIPKNFVKRLERSSERIPMISNWPLVTCPGKLLTLLRTDETPA